VLLEIFATRRLRRGLELDFQTAGWLCVFGSLLAVGLQIWQLTRLPYFPGASGYASCFTAWAGMNCAMLLTGTYWTETLLARSLRLRKGILEEGGSASSPLPAARLFRANAEGASYFWGFIGLIATLFWLLFYVI
jgi:hypothetical protein